MKRNPSAVESLELSQPLTVVPEKSVDRQIAYLQQQIEQEQALARILQRVRQSLDRDTVLQAAVTEVRRLLQADRVLILQFAPDMSGKIVTESVGVGWPVALGHEIQDTCFQAEGRERYRLGRQVAIANIETVNLSDCHRALMAQFAVRATLVVPILTHDQLWGLLIAHQCSRPRHWQPDELLLLERLTVQLAIAIRQSELHQQILDQAALLNVTTDAILVKDLGDHIVFWNRGAEALYGWTEAEALGQTASQLLYANANPQLSDIQQHLIEHESWQGELVQVTKAGQPLLVESRWAQVRNRQGQITAILTVNTDVTEKRQLEEQFLRSQRLESIGTLASGIAHDLNNILTPIMGIAQLLPLKLSQLDPETQELLSILQDNAKRGAEIVKQVLTFACGAAGQSTVLKPQTLIQEIHRFIHSTFPKQIAIKLHLAPALWNLKGEVTQLHQVLMNLSVNARDAMPQGGTLTLKADNLWVDEAYTRTHLDAQVGPYVVFTVTDTGAGMPPTVVERIFEPFYTTKPLGKGTGLGLSTVLGIVKRHEGFITVHSQVGQGTTFQVHLPALTATNLVPSDNLSRPQGQAQMILLVDDEASIRIATQTLLEAYQYRVETAQDGLDAITTYAQHPADIGAVLMDLMMPDMDGETAIKALLRINPQAKIIATSGLMSSETFLNSPLGTQVSAFLSKPYTAELLLTALDQVLN
jgi:two-component system cell cycle sensor histidine kinase/response regulator CckA